MAQGAGLGPRRFAASAPPPQHRAEDREGGSEVRPHDREGDDQGVEVRGEPNCQRAEVFHSPASAVTTGALPMHAHPKAEIGPTSTPARNDVRM